MTLSLPWTFSRDDPAGVELEDRLQDVFDRLAGAVPDTGGISLGLRAGTGTLTWPGGAVTSNQLTVSHGLAGTPVSVVAVSGANTGVALPPVLQVFTFTATTFKAQASTVDGTNPLNTATTTVYWVAIG